MAEFRCETERLILRDWREEDWPLFWDGTNTPAVMTWLGGVLDQAGMDNARGRLEMYRREHGHTFWCVERKDDRAILGFCGLKLCTEELGPLGMPELGYRFREDAWGKGYAKEAARASLEAGFGEFGHEEIIALTVEGNRDSWGLMRKLGMQRRPEMDFPETFWAQDYGPVIVHSIMCEQWKAVNG